MRRFRYIALILALLLVFAGCEASSETMTAPASFYYRVSAGTFGKQDSIIASERRESAGCEDDLKLLIESYLEGPVSGKLTSPVPASARVLGVTRENSKIIVEMSPAFAKLSGIDLTIACSCLSMTLLDYTDAEQIEIFVPHTLLDGNDSIVMERDSLMLLDNSLNSPKETQ